MHLHVGWGTPKAASEMSLGKHVVFPKDVIYALPQMGMRHFCWWGQAEAGGSPGRAALPAATFAGCHAGLALPRDRLKRCAQFVFSVAEPKDGLPAVMGAQRSAMGPALWGLCHGHRKLDQELEHRGVRQAMAEHQAPPGGGVLSPLGVW